MKFSHASARRAVVAVAFVLCAISAPVFGAVVTYDPSLGTLPQAQGFGFIESGGASPEIEYSTRLKDVRGSRSNSASARPGSWK